MGSTASLLWGFVFGCIGMGYCIYGKRQQSWGLLQENSHSIFPSAETTATLLPL